jgi:hypothetical protein
VPRIHHPIGFCPKCGSFPATAVALGGEGAGGTFIGCSTNCPRCNGDAEIVPGTYEVIGERLSLLVDPSVTPAARAALQEIAKRAQAGEITPQEAKEAAEKIAPGSGKLFDIASWSGQAKATLYAAIIGAAAVVGAAKMASQPSHTVNVQPVIERVIERTDLRSSTSLTPTARLPRPRPKQPR